ncbi:MAG: hypothetical protein ACYTXE_45165 [Nostoc sp.]
MVGWTGNCVADDGGVAASPNYQRGYWAWWIWTGNCVTASPIWLGFVSG